MPDETLKVAICIPTTGTNCMGFTYSLSGMIARVAAGLPTRPEATVLVSMLVQESSVIITNRELLVRSAIDQGFTHLLFLDHDMVFEPTILDVMLGRRHPVVVVNYRIKSDDGEFVAVDLDNRRVATTERSTGLQPIAYSGFGVSLFETAVFKATPQPWFMPDFCPETSTYTTEDLPCFRRIREAGFPVYLDHDASKLVTGHVGTKGYSWRDWKPPQKKPAEPLCPQSRIATSPSSTLEPVNGRH